MTGQSRRRFLHGSLALASLGLLSGCALLPPRAQQATPGPTIGWISGASAEANTLISEAFRRGLGEQGYVEGRNITVEWRFAEGRDERLPDLLAELVRRDVALIVTSGTQAALAAKQASATI